jgi:transcriptional regulator with XRE-family HTH domain
MRPAVYTNDYRKNLGRILKQQRQTENLTLQALSQASGVSMSHLGRIENGERFPSAYILKMIAKPLRFTEDELFSLAGYFTPRLATEVENDPAINKNALDPYVARVLSQENFETQRAVIGILTMLKSIAGSITPPEHSGSSQSAG